VASRYCTLLFSPSLTIDAILGFLVYFSCPVFHTSLVLLPYAMLFFTDRFLSLCSTPSNPIQAQIIYFIFLEHAFIVTCQWWCWTHYILSIKLCEHPGNIYSKLN
jgi:hypothetical protein